MREKDPERTVADDLQHLGGRSGCRPDIPAGKKADDNVRKDYGQLSLCSAVIYSAQRLKQRFADLQDQPDHHKYRQLRSTDIGLYKTVGDQISEIEIYEPSRAGRLDNGTESF